MFDSLLSGASNMFSRMGSSIMGGLDSLLGMGGGGIPSATMGSMPTSVLQGMGESTSGGLFDSLLSTDQLGNLVGAGGKIMGIMDSRKNSKANRSYLQSQQNLQEDAYNRSVEADEKRQALNF